MPSSGLWEQAEPGWRSAADMQRVEAWRAETNVQREGVGSPERRGRHVPIAYAIGLPDFETNVQREGVGSPERRGRHAPIAYAIGLPDFETNVQREGVGSPERSEIARLRCEPYGMRRRPGPVRPARPFHPAPIARLFTDQAGSCRCTTHVLVGVCRTDEEKRPSRGRQR